MLLSGAEIRAATRCHSCVSNGLTPLTPHLWSLSFQCHVRMSSLVAYEESESEDESVDQVDKGASVSVQTRSLCEPQRKTVACSSSEGASCNPHPERTLLEYYGKVSELNRSSHQPHSQPQSCSDRETKYYNYRTAQDMHFRDTTAPLSLPVTQGEISPRQTLPHMSQRFSDGLNPAKRHHTVPSGLRPYIPKRQRLATSVKTVDPQSSAQQVSENQTREGHILSDISERVKPYLGRKPNAAGIPKRLLMSLGGHQGPVNTVQWCPVPHLSHLLLSASMDKTFKVMTTTTWLSLAYSQLLMQFKFQLKLWCFFLQTKYNWSIMSWNTKIHLSA